MSVNGKPLRERATAQPPGSIVIPIADMMRHTEFFLDIVNLLGVGGLPPDSSVALNRSASVVQNLNDGIAGMDANHEWAWIMGDDHRFSGDILVRLLEHDVDIVLPLCVKRSPPFQLTCYRKTDDIIDRVGRNYPAYFPIIADEVPDELFEVDAAGSAGMLVRRSVFDALGYPYFENTDGVYLNEDLEFCRRAIEAGFKVWVDPHTWLGHIGQFTVWPSRYEGQLVFKIDHGGEDGENEVMIGLRRQFEGEPA